MKKHDVQDRLKKGIVKLLEKKFFLDITVTDLVKESKIARASFYRLYSSVDEVLNDAISDVDKLIEKNTLAAIINVDKERIRKIIYWFFDSADKNTIPLLHILPENISFVIATFEKQSLLTGGRLTDNLYNKYAPTLFFMNLISLAATWIRFGKKETVGEMTDFVYKLYFEKSERW